MASSSFDVLKTTLRLSKGRPRRKKDVKTKASMINQPLMTTNEYLRTPEWLVPTELIYGVMRVADAPLPHHQRAVRDLCFALVEHAETRHLGEVWMSPLDVILDAERALVLQPDLLFISNERSHILTDRVRGAPDLVVEVLSPNPRIGELGERIAWFAEYRRQGVLAPLSVSTAGRGAQF